MTNQLTTTGVDELLKHLFADKKTIYIDDINFSRCGGYDVSWCLEFTLSMTTPQWMDTHLCRPVLLTYIRNQNLNEWEAYKHDGQTGNLQPYTVTVTDLETFLNEHYEEIIKGYMEENY